MNGLHSSSLRCCLLIKGGGSQEGLVNFSETWQTEAPAVISLKPRWKPKGPHRTDFLSRQKIPAEASPCQDVLDLRVPAPGGPDLCQVSIRTSSPNSRIVQHNKNIVNDDPGVPGSRHNLLTMWTGVCFYLSLRFFTHKIDVKIRLSWPWNEITCVKVLSKAPWKDQPSIGVGKHRRGGSHEFQHRLCVLILWSQASCWGGNLEL